MRLSMLLVVLFGCSSGGNGGSDTSSSGDGGTDDGGSDGGSGDGGATQDCSGGTGLPPESTLIEADGMSALVYVPVDLIPCAPLVIFAHGGGSPGSFTDGRWMDALGTHLQEEANFRKYVLLVPGVAEGERPEHTWSFEMDTQVDALIEAAQAGANLNRSQTWMIGQSAGGHMTAWMALSHPDLLSGAAVVSAGLGSYFEYPDPEPDRKLPVYVGHDPDDEIIDYQKSVHLAEELEAHEHVYQFVDLDIPGNGHGWSDNMTPSILDWLSVH